MYYSNKCAIKKLSKTPGGQRGNGAFKNILRDKFKEMERSDPIESLRSSLKPRRGEGILLSGEGFALPGEGIRLSGEGMSLISKNRQVATLERKFGDQKITGFKICRKPISKGIRTALNILTLGKLSEIEKEMDYVEAFHLFLYVELENGKVFKIHKNAVVDVEYTDKVPAGSKCISKQVKPIHTIREMISKAEIFNPQLYRYNAQLYNCQNFILSLLKPLGYWDKKIKTFTMQDFQDLFTPATGMLTQGLTNVKGLLDRMMGKGGEGLNLAGPDPLQNLRMKMGDLGERIKPTRVQINKFLREGLRAELKANHIHLDPTHIAKIIRNFKLHKDEKSIPGHSLHLTKQLLKHYFVHKRGDGVMETLLTPLNKISEAILRTIWSGIQTRMQAQSGQGLNLKHLFSKVGKYLLSHRKGIAKAIKTGANIGSVVATALGQPELAVPLKGLSSIAGVIEKF